MFIANIKRMEKFILFNRADAWSYHWDARQEIIIFSGISFYYGRWKRQQ